MENVDVQPIYSVENLKSMKPTLPKFDVKSILQKGLSPEEGNLDDEDLKKVTQTKSPWVDSQLMQAYSGKEQDEETYKKKPLSNELLQLVSHQKMS